MPDTFKTFEEMCAYLETGDKPTEQNFRDILYTLTNGGTDPVLTKRLKALISQNAPIATTDNPSMIAGQVWTLDAYNAADAATIAALELVSGVLNAVGSTYRSATDQTLVLNVATTLSYDGAPYIVSTDSDDAFAPFNNSLSALPVLVYDNSGLNGPVYIAELAGEFPDKSKVIVKLSSTSNAAHPVSYRIDADKVGFHMVDITDPSTYLDGQISYAELLIEVCP